MSEHPFFPEYSLLFYSVEIHSISSFSRLSLKYPHKKQEVECIGGEKMGLFPPQIVHVRLFI
jgi:hypothetical protein